VLKNLLAVYARHIKGLSCSSRVINFSFAKHKAKPFLIQPDENRSLTFQELETLTEKAVLLLAEKGIGEAEVAAFSASNCIDYFIIRAACHIRGVIFFGLPPTLTQEQTIHFLTVSKAKIFFYQNRDDAAIEEIKAKAQVKYLVELNTGFHSTTTDEAKPRKTRLSLVTDGNQCATFNLSSATTSKTPKIIRLSDTNWIESLYGYIRNATLKTAQRNVFFCSVPLLTAGSTTFLPCLLSGFSCLVVKETIAIEHVVSYSIQYNVTRLYITPSRLLELLEWCKIHNQHFSALESIVTGTERIPTLRLKEAIDYFGPIISVGYGMAEALPPISLLSPGVYHKLGSVGKIAKGVKIKITDEGRIAIKSKTVSMGYLDNPTETSQHFKDGWFYSDDYGYIDKDKYLYIFGRKEEILTESPRRIFAKEAEDKLYTLAFINRCAVLSRNAQMYIFASLREAIGNDQAKNAIQKIFDENFKNILALKKIIIKEALPINAFGKLDRRRLEEEITIACATETLFTF